VVGSRLVPPRWTSPVAVEAPPAQVLALVRGSAFISLVVAVLAFAVSMVVGEQGPYLVAGLLGRKL